MCVATISWISVKHTLTPNTTMQVEHEARKSTNIGCAKC